MALPAMLVLTTLTLVLADKLAADDSRNAQNENAVHSVLSAMVQAMVTAASPQTDEEDRGVHEPKTKSHRNCTLNQVLAGTQSSNVCSLDDCSEEDSDGRRAKREAFTAVQAPLDALIDFAIGFAVHKYALIHGGRIPMEDLGKGRLRLTNGTIGDLRDVVRKEPVTLRRALVDGQQSLLITFTGGFQFVDIHYRYQYKIPLITHSGYVQGSLSPVVVRGHLLLQLPCRVRLLVLNISHMGSFSLNGTGFWPLNGFIFGLLRDLADRTVRDALFKVVGDIRKQIQGEFDAIACPP